MLDFEEIVIETPRVHSLVWEGETLVDWAAGGRRFHLDGTKKESGVYFAYRFDAATTSPSGDFTVIYERLGTKAALLKNGKLHRELNRSYYHANVYEYPIALFQLPDGAEAIVHCPRDYNRLDIELADSGRCLTDEADRDPNDTFHSRLSFSPSGAYLASAGWIWHPLDVACLWSAADVSHHPPRLDRSGVDLPLDGEVQAVAFIDDEFLLLATGKDPADKPASKTTAELTVAHTRDGSIASRVTTETPVGTVFALGPDKALGCYEHPRVFDLESGAVLHEWPHLRTGKQLSSIVHHVEPPPPMAFTASPPMFAVAQEGTITVLRFRL